MQTLAADKLRHSDFNWFVENYRNLYETYGRAYLAIKQKKVLGKYRTYAEGVRATKKKEEPGTFIVQLCDGTEAAYTNYISSMNFLHAQ